MKFSHSLFALIFSLFSTLLSASQNNALGLDDDPLSFLSAKHLVKNWKGDRQWMSQNRIIILDTETTGLSHVDRVVQLSMYEVYKGQMTGRTYNSYFNPGRPSSYHAKKAHRLGEAFLKSQPLFKTKFREIKEWIGGSLVMGHNISFDVRMLMNEFQRLDYNPHSTTQESWTLYTKDTCHMTRRKDKRQTNPDKARPSPAPKRTKCRRLTPKGLAIRDAARVERSTQNQLKQQVRHAKRAREATDEHTQTQAPSAKKARCYKLGHIVNNVLKTTPHKAVECHGFDLQIMAQQGNIPKERQGVYHDAFTDVAGNLAVFDYLNPASVSE